jgi:PAS domain S-box-containing protein
LYNASREMEQQLLANEESQRRIPEAGRLLFQNSGEGMMVTDAAGVILTVNPAFSLLSGYTEKELIGHRAYELLPAATTRNFRPHVRMRDQKRLLEGRIVATKQAMARNTWSRCWSTPSTMSRAIRSAMSLCSAISPKKASEELIWRQANFDALTGLPNRRMFHEHLRQEMKKPTARSCRWRWCLSTWTTSRKSTTRWATTRAICCSKKWQPGFQCVRSTDTVARLGGDEFTVILSELRNAGDVVRTAQEILKKMSTPFQLGENVAHISSSIGITLYPEDGKDAETLIKNADQAMYAAKQQGRNRFNYFAPFMQEATRERMTWSANCAKPCAR